MLYSKKTDYLMESIRLGREMDRREKLNLIVGLSIPSYAGSDFYGDDVLH